MSTAPQQPGDETRVAETEVVEPFATTNGSSPGDATTGGPPPADTAQVPAAAAVPARAAEVRTLRVGTVVWGLVLAVLGVGVLAWAADRRIDVGLAAILLVAGAGVALLVGSLVTGARERRHAPTD